MNTNNRYPSIYDFMFYEKDNEVYFQKITNDDVTKIQTFDIPPDISVLSL